MHIMINGRPRPVAAGTTLDAALAEFGVPARGVAAAVDGTVVPRAKWDSTELHEGAAVEVLTAVQGG